MIEDVIWAQKYRPKTIEECILPHEIKIKFMSYLEKGVIDDNLVLVGSPGLGKTSSILALTNQLGSEKYLINASLHGNIDVLRNQVQNFAARMSMNGERKYVIFDEAERLTIQTQEAIRGFIEQYSKTCGFIFTCNTKSPLHEAILSRTSVIEFSVTGENKIDMLKEFYKRVVFILKKESIEFDKKVVQHFILSNQNSIDFRNILIQIQGAVLDGKLNGDNLKDKQDEAFIYLIELLKKKDFNNMRKWIVDHPEYSDVDIFTKIYKKCSDIATRETAPLLVLLVAKYQYQASFVSNKDINLASFLTECMVDVEFE